MTVEMDKETMETVMKALCESRDAYKYYNNLEMMSGNRTFIYMKQLKKIEKAISDLREQGCRRCRHEVARIRW